MSETVAAVIGRVATGLLDHSTSAEDLQALCDLHRDNCPPEVEDNRLMVEYCLKEAHPVDPTEVTMIVNDLCTALSIDVPVVEAAPEEESTEVEDTTETLVDIANSTAAPPAGPATGTVEALAHGQQLASGHGAVVLTDELSGRASETKKAKAPAPAPKAKAQAKPAPKQAPSKHKPVKARTLDETELREMAMRISKTKSKSVDPLELLRDGLIYLVLDPVAQAARIRDQVANLIGVSCGTVELITTMAAHHGFELDGSPVGPSRDFLDWDHERLGHLIGLMDARVSQAKGDVERAAESTVQLTSDNASLREKIGEAAKVIEDLRSQLTVLRDDKRDRALEANQLLASHVDQDVYVVAQLDPVTEKPVKYVRAEPSETRGEPDVLRSSTLAKSSKFSTWDDAQAVRTRLSRRKAARASIEPPRIAVMQMSLRVVRAEDL